MMAEQNEHSRVITLGGTDYVIKRRGILANKRWRERFFDGELPDLVTQLIGLADFEFNKPEDLAQLLPSLRLLVVDTVDILFDAVMDYAPDLEPHREAIGETAYEEELIAAFWEVLQLAVPFQMLGDMLAQISATDIGRQLLATSPNSPSASGESETTS